MRRKSRRLRQGLTKRTWLSIEPLEPRTVLSATIGGAALPLVEADAPDNASVQKAIVAGDPGGTPADSPASRVDPNTTTSPFAGVGSLFMDLGGGSGYICTGTAISPTHVLTAGHCLDIDDDGGADFAATDVSFFLNYGANFSHTLTASALYLHDNFTGFANPSVLDDIAVIELSSSLPAGVPIYAISEAPFVNIETTTLAGYGTTGDAINGYINGSASFTIKRTGQNHADAFLSDDEGSGAREGFEWDFDGDHKKFNVFGPPQAFNLTLGNDFETTIGGGDSGGPSFIDDGNGGLLLFGVNTFTGGGGKAAAPFFGSIGGGIVVSAYASWINGIISGVNQPPTANAGEDQGVTTGSGVQLDGSGSSDPENDPLTYSWTLDVPPGSSAVLSDPTEVNPTFAADVDGSYTATLVVNDGQQHSVADSVTINAAPAGTSMHVGDIDGSSQIKGKSGKWSANVTVAIHDDNGIPVAGATVMAQWSGAVSIGDSGITAEDGTVTFSSGNLNSGNSVTLEVTDVNGSLTYDASSNHDPDGDSDGTTITVQKEDGARAKVRALIQLSTPANVPLVWFAQQKKDAGPNPTNVIVNEAIDVALLELAAADAKESQLHQKETREARDVDHVVANFSLGAADEVVSDAHLALETVLRRGV